ncbi:MAG: CGNR zinc finger domain-containing protein [Acidimicrobiales bacterium]
MANALAAGDLDARAMLSEAGFTRAPTASEASMSRLVDRLGELLPLFDHLADADDAQATRRINEQLTELAVAPAVQSHDGIGPHIHWTPANATFDDQVITDVVMALAQEICDHGTLRFGRCGAADCENLYFDQTRNHSRRFCSDSRCASRTHTADHRARRRSS